MTGHDIGGIKFGGAKATGFDEAALARVPAFLQGYIDKGKVAGISALVVRGGQVAQFAQVGSQALGGEPVAADTIFRIYSMSKPITSIGLMMLCEEGQMRLDEPVSRYIPEFADVRVWRSGNNLRPVTRGVARDINLRDLLTHTSGLTYGFMHSHPVDRFYRHARIGEMDMRLEDMAKLTAKLPLLFDPGEKWNYSVATDICGRVIEVASGMTLDAFFETRIFKPLGMKDTGFFVSEAQAPRLAANYEKDPKGKGLREVDAAGAKSAYAKKPNYLSGGGGLVSTMGDYARFCSMLAGKGQFEGVRLVSPKTIELMTQNHLPDDKSLAELSISTFSENRFDGAGFGLGFSVVMNPAATMLPTSKGAFSWGGAASTYFWVDPAEDLFAILMTQFMPSDYYPLRPQFQQLVYGAMATSKRCC